MYTIITEHDILELKHNVTHFKTFIRYLNIIVFVLYALM